MKKKLLCFCRNSCDTNLEMELMAKKRCRCFFRSNRILKIVAGLPDGIFSKNPNLGTFLMPCKEKVANFLQFGNFMAIW
jgi:hypothetical protein